MVLTAATTWTTAPPTAPGFYWAKFHALDYPYQPGVTVVEVVEEHGQLLVYALAEDGSFTLDTVAEWAGPMEPPP